MSRIGKLPITIPEKVKVEVKDNTVFVEGPKGKLDYGLPEGIFVNMKDTTILVEKETDLSKLNQRSGERYLRSMHGLVRSLVNNMIIGVSEGYSKELSVIGVGYRAQMKGDSVLSLFVGHSHPIDYFLPEGISAKVTPGKGVTKILIEGKSKELVGEIAAQIRKFRPPEPYKGKGIRYTNEYVKKKAGKSVVGK